MARDLQKAKKTKSKTFVYRTKSGRASHVALGSESHLEALKAGEKGLSPLELKRLRATYKPPTPKDEVPKPKVDLIVPKQVIRQYGKTLFTIAPGADPDEYLQRFPGATLKWKVSYGPELERSRTFGSEKSAQKFADDLRREAEAVAHRATEASFAASKLYLGEPGIPKTGFEMVIPWLSKIREEAEFEKIKPHEDMTDEEKVELYKSTVLSLKPSDKKKVDPKVLEARLKYVGLVGIPTAAVSAAVTAVTTAAGPTIGTFLAINLIITQLKALKNTEKRKQFVRYVKANPEEFFLAVGGSIAGTYVGTKIRKPKITVKTLEQRAYDKLTLPKDIPRVSPDEHIPDMFRGLEEPVSVQVGVGKWGGAMKVPRGTWPTTWDLAKDVARKGGTSIVALREPGTKNVVGYLKWVEVVKMTDGTPSLMAALTSLTAVPVVFDDGKISDQTIKQIQKTQPSLSYYEKFKQKDEDILLAPQILKIDAIIELDTLTQQIQEIVQKQIQKQGVNQSVKQVQDRIQKQVQTLINQQGIIQDIDQIQGIIQTQIQIQIQEEALRQDVQPILEETIVEPIPVALLPEVEARAIGKLPKVRLGSPGKYRVTLSYHTKATEVKSVTASNYIDAIGKGVATSRNKRQLIEVEAERIK